MTTPVVEAKETGAADLFKQAGDGLPGSTAHQPYLPAIPILSSQTSIALSTPPECTKGVFHAPGDRNSATASRVRLEAGGTGARSQLCWLSCLFHHEGQEHAPLRHAVRLPQLGSPVLYVLTTEETLFHMGLPNSVALDETAYCRQNLARLGYCRHCRYTGAPNTQKAHLLKMLFTGDA